MRFGNLSRGLIRRIAESEYTWTSHHPEKPKKKMSQKVGSAIGHTARAVKSVTPSIGTVAAVGSAALKQAAANVATHILTKKYLDHEEKQEHKKRYYGDMHPEVKTHPMHDSGHKAQWDHEEMRKKLSNPPEHEKEKKDDEDDEDSESHTHKTVVPKGASHKSAAKSVLLRGIDNKTSSTSSTSAKLKSDGSRRKKTTENISEQLTDRVNSIY